MVFTGEDLAKWTGGYWKDDVPSTVEGLFFDTRIIKPKSLVYCFELWGSRWA